MSPLATVWRRPAGAAAAFCGAAWAVSGASEIAGAAEPPASGASEIGEDPLRGRRRLARLSGLGNRGDVDRARVHHRDGDARAQRGVLGLQLVVLPLEPPELLLDAQVLGLALQRLAGERARELALGRVDHPAHVDRLLRVGLELQVLPEVVDREDRVLAVVQEDEPGVQVGLGRRVPAPVDDLEVVGKRLVPPSLALHLLPVPVARVVRLR